MEINTYVTSYVLFNVAFIFVSWVRWLGKKGINIFLVNLQNNKAMCWFSLRKKATENHWKAHLNKSYNPKFTLWSLNYFSCNLQLWMCGIFSYHRMVWVERDGKNHLVPSPLPWAGAPFTGCSKFCPSWPRMFHTTASLGSQGVCLPTLT